MINFSQITILLFLLFFTGSSSAYGQMSQLSSNSLYDNSVSNGEISFSVDKFTYNEGEQVKFLGYVHDPHQGVRVFITIVDPSGNVLSSLNVGTTNDGSFMLLFDIPPKVKAGDYSIVTQYGSYGTPADLKISIVTESIGTLIIIPKNSQFEGSGINFDPQLVTVEAGLRIVWINEDDTVHTVISGDGPYENESDKRFSDVFIRPQNSFEMVLGEGEYAYFCKLHPWLDGYVIVIPSSNPQNEQQEKEKVFGITLLDNAEDLSFWSHENCDNCKSNIELSADRREGLSSFRFNVKGDQFVDGITRAKAVLGFNSLDLNNFLYLKFWIKTLGNVDGVRLVLLDSLGKVLVLDTISGLGYPSWTELQLELTNLPTGEEGFDPTRIVGLQIHSPEAQYMKNRQISVLIDNVNLLSLQNSEEVKDSASNAVTLTTNKGSYDKTEIILVSGFIKKMESGIPVTISLLGPNNNLVLIEQILPDKDNSFSFEIPLFGNQFEQEGNYKILAKFGVENITNEIQFTLNNPKLVERYKGYDIYSLVGSFYGKPYPEGQFDIGNIEFEKINTNSTEDMSNFKIKQNLIPKSPHGNILIFNNIDEMKREIDNLPLIGPYLLEEYFGFNIFALGESLYAIPQNEGTIQLAKIQNNEYGKLFQANNIVELKTIIDSTRFPVPDDVLLAIWNEKADLQTVFPEVSGGNFDNLRVWAKDVGWNEDPRLSVLIPEGQTPAYLIEEESIVDGVIIPIIVVAILASAGYFILKRRNLIKKKLAKN